MIKEKYIYIICYLKGKLFIKDHFENIKSNKFS